MTNEMLKDETIRKEVKKEIKKLIKIPEVAKQCQMVALPKTNEGYPSYNDAGLDLRG